MNTLAEKGLLIFLLGLQISQRFCKNSRFKIPFFFLWQRLQFALHFYMESRVKDGFLSCGLQFGHPFLYEDSRYICFSVILPGGCTCVTPSCINNLRGNYFFLFRGVCLICFLLALISYNEAIGLPQPVGLLSREWLLSAWSACPFTSIAFSYLTFRRLQCVAWKPVMG
jgi:hypothetical protein